MSSHLPLLTVQEAAGQLRLSVPTVERLVKSGELFSIKISEGRRGPRRIPQSAVDDFVKDRIAEAKTSSNEMTPSGVSAPDRA